MVCMSEKKGGDYRCLFISFIEYQHICTVGVNIKSTHAVHLSLQVYTCDSNYRVFTTIKIRSNVYMVWPYTVLYRGKINYLSVQCHLNVLDLLSYSQKNIKKNTKEPMFIFIIAHVNEIKYWKHHVGLYVCTPFWQRFYIHTHVYIRSLLVFECQNTWPMIMTI
jgi:hypothetical protein